MEIENTEITINFNKIWNIIRHRKLWIFLCFTVVIFSTTALTLVTPKKYLSSAELLINKSNSTNLTEINPFLISTFTSDKGGLGSMLAGNSGIAVEMELIKSPLVLDPVIRENGLKYEDGREKGEYISAKDLLDQSLSIEGLQDSGKIVISYKSKKPKLAYNVVSSVITNYRGINEKINSKKAIQDSEFLKNVYFKAKKDFDQKFGAIKSDASVTQTGSDINYIMLGKYDKRIENQLKNMNMSGMDNQKISAEFDQEKDNLRTLKQKYEWSLLVKNISKDTTNINVIKNPDIPKSFEYSEPKLSVNLLISILLSFTLSFIMLIKLENSDKKLSYINIDDKFILIKREDDIRTYDIEKEIILNKIPLLGIISLTDDKNITAKFIENLKTKLDENKIDFSITSVSDSLNAHITNMEKSKNLILILEVGSTDIKLYEQIKSLSKKLNINILSEFVLR